MERRWVEDKLKVLKTQRDQLAANLHAHDGAIQVCEELLQRDSLPDASSADSSGGVALGHPSSLSSP